MENQKKSHEPAAKPATFRANLVLVSGFLIVVIIGLVSLGFLYADLIPVQAYKPMKQDYPILAEGAKINKATVGWIEQANNSPTKKQEAFLPQVTLELSADSTDADFTCYFTNSANKPVGDGYTPSIKQGKFTLSGKNTLTFTGSKGFSQDAYFRAYRYEEKDFWSFVINQTDELGHTKEIARIPLPAILLEN